MDNNSIAVLQDYQTSIESSFKKIERLFTEVEGADLSQQNLASNNINNELNNIKNNMGLIKFEIANLKEESNTNKWNEIVSQLNSRYDSYKERLKQLKNNQTNYANDDSLNIAYINKDKDGYDYLEEIEDKEIFNKAMLVVKDMMSMINKK